MSPILGIYASQISGHLFTASAFDSIATTTVGAGGTSTITFSSIPSTYTHLQVRLICANNSSYYDSDIVMRFNGDTGSNYYKHRIYGSGSSVATDAGAGTTMQVARSGGAAGVFGASVIDILDYTNTSKNKVVRSLYGQDSNGSGYMMFSSGLWNNTSAVTSLTLNDANFNGFVQYTHAALYGIKGN